MQTANILLALGGDSGNVVPKYGVTPAEVAVLRQIHGDESVTDIEPGEDIDRSNRAERARLAEAYGRRVDGRFVAPAVDALFPGVASRVYEDFEELDLPELFFKAERRVTSKSKRVKAEPETETDEDEDEKPAARAAKPAKSAKPAKAAKAAPTPAPEPAAAQDDSDGIGEINDEHSGKSGDGLFN